jgi:Ni2+-binding GTPase involved in maturation of urease and hydrogenase
MAGPGGNPVCPALFDLGEQAKIVIFSVTEGEDKSSLAACAVAAA